MTDNRMTAIDLAEYLTDWNVVKTNPFSKVIGQKSADMLRRQHEAIVKLREALDEINKHADGVDDQWCGAIAEQALKDTEEF